MKPVWEKIKFNESLDGIRREVLKNVGKESYRKEQEGLDIGLIFHQINYLIRNEVVPFAERISKNGNR